MGVNGFIKWVAKQKITTKTSLSDVKLTGSAIVVDLDNIIADIYRSLPTLRQRHAAQEPLLQALYRQDIETLWAAFQPLRQALADGRQVIYISKSVSLSTLVA